MKPPRNSVVGPRTPLFKQVPHGGVAFQPGVKTNLQAEMLEDKKQVPVYPLQHYAGQSYMNMVKPCRAVNDINRPPRFQGDKPFNTTSVSARPWGPLSKLGFSYQRVEPFGGNLRQNNNLLRTNY